MELPSSANPLEFSDSSEWISQVDSFFGDLSSSMELRSRANPLDFLDSPEWNSQVDSGFGDLQSAESFGSQSGTSSSHPNSSIQEIDDSGSAYLFLPRELSGAREPAMGVDDPQSNEQDNPDVSAIQSNAVGVKMRTFVGTLNKERFGRLKNLQTSFVDTLKQKEILRLDSPPVVHPNSILPPENTEFSPPTPVGVSRNGFRDLVKNVLVSDVNGSVSSVVLEMEVLCRSKSSGKFKFLQIFSAWKATCKPVRPLQKIRKNKPFPESAKASSQKKNHTNSFENIPGCSALIRIQCICPTIRAMDPEDSPEIYPSKPFKKPSEKILPRKLSFDDSEDSPEFFPLSSPRILSSPKKNRAENMEESFEISVPTTSRKFVINRIHVLNNETLRRKFGQQSPSPPKVLKINRLRKVNVEKLSALMKQKNNKSSSLGAKLSATDQRRNMEVDVGRNNPPVAEIIGSGFVSSSTHPDSSNPSTSVRVFSCNESDATSSSSSFVPDPGVNVNPSLDSSASPDNIQESNTQQREPDQGSRTQGKSKLWSHGVIHSKVVAKRRRFNEWDRKFDD